MNPSTTRTEDALKSFLAKLKDKITATLDCFDRVIFKGHLRPISFAQGLAQFMAQRGFKIKDFERFVQTHSDQPAGSNIKDAPTAA